MNALDNLVRISRWHLDEARQKLGDLERLEVRLREDIRRLDANLAAEQLVAFLEEQVHQLGHAFGDDHRVTVIGVGHRLAQALAQAFVAGHIENNIDLFAQLGDLQRIFVDGDAALGKAQCHR